MSVNYEMIRNDKQINAYIEKANANLGILGYTDHSKVHTMLVSKRAAMILNTIGATEKETELVQIAGFMHDIGNAINRKSHAEYGALLADSILKDMDISLEDRITIVSAIANHDESSGLAVDRVSAALIIADKTDVRRNRVRTKDKAAFDIHDRVNCAVTDNKLSISKEEKIIKLELTVDEEICTMYEYFDIFLQRMLMSKRAAEFLGYKFSLIVNHNKIL
ncbi:MAG: HD domain-containing protein [Anaerofustis stercorihominis]|nr:HD domain-containing protein [Anaerofustis stercorihominis]